jgi:hypothetical protein
MVKRCDKCEGVEVKYVKTLDLYLCKNCTIETIESLIVEGDLVEDVKFYYELSTGV